MEINVFKDIWNQDTLSKNSHIAVTLKIASNWRLYATYIIAVKLNRVTTISIKRTVDTFRAKHNTSSRQKHCIAKV